MVVKARHVLVQHSREMAAVNDQYPVQQFPAGSSNPSFGDRVRLGCPHRVGLEYRIVGLTCGFRPGLDSYFGQRPLYFIESAAGETQDDPDTEEPRGTMASRNLNVSALPFTGKHQQTKMYAAGRIKSTHTRPGNPYLKGALGVAAMSAARSKDTDLS